MVCLNSWILFLFYFYFISWTMKMYMTVVTWHYIIDLEYRRRGWKSNIKIYINSMFILRYIHSILIANILLYASPSNWKLHPHGDIISKLYKPTFYSSHLFCNMSYGSAVTIQVFYLLMVKILLFNLVFYDRVISISVSILKPLLGVIETIPLKSQASSIVGSHI